MVKGGAYMCLSLQKNCKRACLVDAGALLFSLARARTHTNTNTTQTMHVENAAAKAPTVMLHQMTVHDMYYEPRC